MTQKEFLTAVLEEKPLDFAIEDVTVKEKAESMLKAIEKRAAASKGKPSKKYEENAPIRAAITEFLSDKDESTTAKEIAEAIEETPQKTSSVLRQMVQHGDIQRIDLGRSKPLEYRLPSGNATEE